MKRRSQKSAVRLVLPLALPVLLSTLAACSSSTSDGAASIGTHPGDDASASGGDMNSGGAANSGGATSSGGTTNSSGGQGSPGGSGGVSIADAGAAGGAADGDAGDAGFGSECDGVPLPLSDALPEPTVTIDPSATLQEIAISGPSSTYAIGGTPGTLSVLTVTLLDQGLYSDGSVRYIENLTADIDYHSKVVWTSSDPTIAGVASGDSRTAGGIQGYRAGTVTITASLGSVKKSVCFVVTPPVVNQLTITGPGMTSSYDAPIVEQPGDDAPLTCTATLTDGTKRDVTGEVTWASSVPAVATVSASGSTHASTGGTTVITATLPASVATSSPTVSAATVTLDVIGTTGLQQGAACQATPQACAAGLSCCQDGRLSPTSSCIPTLSGSFPCPMYP